MGYSLRYFLAEGDGTLTLVPTARYHRWLSEGEALPAARAGRELRLLEAVVDTDRHRVVDVLRILPVRHWVGQDARIDASAAMRVALKRLEILERVSAGDASAQIEELQADANYFWWPTDVQLEALGTALLLYSERDPANLEAQALAHYRANPLGATIATVVGPTVQEPSAPEYIKFLLPSLSSVETTD